MAEKNGNDNRLNVVSTGELENITRPASSKRKVGSRATPGSNSNVASASSHRFHSGTSLAPSLELLTPEEVMGQVSKS